MHDDNLLERNCIFSAGNQSTIGSYSLWPNFLTYHLNFEMLTFAGTVNDMLRLSNMRKTSVILINIKNRDFVDWLDSATDLIDSCVENNTIFIHIYVKEYTVTFKEPGWASRYCRQTCSMRCWPFYVVKRFYFIPLRTRIVHHNLESWRI